MGTQKGVAKFGKSRQAAALRALFTEIETNLQGVAKFGKKTAKFGKKVAKFGKTQNLKPAQALALWGVKNSVRYL